MHRLYDKSQNALQVRCQSGLLKQPHPSHICRRRDARFATKEPNGLLLYNGRFNEKHDFIAMEIINEQIQLTFSAGETQTTVSPFIVGGVSDGQWHTVEVHYYNK
ncbi:Cadherin EGF LAG seven-pass G-type receptor 2, partial [Characodon lateralis]|nr:Cadherin EGF LAG seven-pass G-type receptor 2 [Characodon lateralis]